MARLHAFSAIAAAASVMLCGCASGAAMTIDRAAAACSGDRSPSSHVEVYVSDARVVRVLGVRRTTSGTHEGFLIDPLDRRTGSSILVEDNTDITGFIPLRSGETVSLLGQFECDDSVIHWTHRDPSGRHAAGYVKVNGTTYR